MELFSFASRACSADPEQDLQPGDKVTAKGHEGVWTVIISGYDKTYKLYKVELGKWDAGQGTFVQRFWAWEKDCERV